MHTRRIALLATTLAVLASAASADFAAENWVLAHGEDDSTHAAVVSIASDAEQTIRDEYDKNDVTPRIAFDCTPGSEAITARIDWHRFISSFNTEIGFRVDGGKTLWQKWGVDRSNMITSSRTEADSAALIEYLGTGSRLSADVAPYSGSPLVVHFDLAGFSTALAALRAEC